MKRIDCDPQTKRNFKLVLEYDGTDYHGWQRQKGFLTVQEVLESRLAIMLGHNVSVRGSGRTDSGVHARGQVVNFNARTRLQPGDFLRGLNGLLPPDVVVTEVEEVSPSFHARYSAKRKTYEYYVLNRALPSALERRTSWHVRAPLDRGAIRACLPELVGTHDFAAFMASGSSVKHTVRTLFRAELMEPGEDRLVFLFEADGFLRKMVRNLVGTLVEVGLGKRGPREFAGLLEECDRRRAGITAPACGLFLVRVDYNNPMGESKTQEGEENESG